MQTAWEWMGNLVSKRQRLFLPHFTPKCRKKNSFKMSLFLLILKSDFFVCHLVHPTSISILSLSLLTVTSPKQINFPKLQTG